MIVLSLRCVFLTLLMVSSPIWQGVHQLATAVPESPTMATLASRLGKSNATTLNEFWNTIEARHTPLIETIPGDDKHVLATFLWRGNPDTRDVVLMAQLNGIEMIHDPDSHLLRLDDTDVWYRTHRLPVDAEFSYMFSINPPDEYAIGYAATAQKSLQATLVADPLNPLQYRILTGPVQSIARMPGVPENHWTSNIDESALRQYVIHSALLTKAKDRKLWVFSTPGHRRNSNLLIVLDADIYMHAVPTPEIINALYLAGKIGPTVTLFVGEGDDDTWLEDHYFSDAYVRFLAEEVVPWAQKQFNVTADRERTVIAGDSIEGMTGAFAALRRPDVFGKVISQSGSFWINNRDADGGEPEWLTRQFAKNKPLDLFFCLDVGQMEFVRNDGDRIFSPFIPGETNLLASNRHLRDVLVAKGYRVRYTEVYADHEPLHWKRTLPDLLIATLAK